MAYGLNKKSDKEIFVLIFDLGGGTFDVSLISIYNGSFEVRATNGDTHLGGEDFTNKILSYCVSEIFKKTGKDISDNPRALSKLRSQCENAKIMLSASTKVNIDCYGLADGCDINIELSRAKFDNLCDEVFKKCMAPIEQVLKDS
jgi:L1 cell adhesion molecule like protein